MTEKQPLLQSDQYVLYDLTDRVDYEQDTSKLYRYVKCFFAFAFSFLIILGLIVLFYPNLSHNKHGGRRQAIPHHDINLQQDLTSVYSRINCFPEYQGYSNIPWPITEEQCKQRNCTYNPEAMGVAEAPPCFMTPDIGYEVVHNPTGFENIHGRQADGSYVLLTLYLKPLSFTPIFDPPVQLLRFTATLYNDKHLRIKIEDANNQRYEVPFTSPMKPKIESNDDGDFRLFYEKKPFAFHVLRRSNQAVLFNTSIGGLVFSDRFLQIATRLPSRQFYGLGEQEHPSILHDLYYKTHAMFARDQPGLGQNLPLYGVHPFYMALEDDGYTSGVFLMNSNAMEVSLLPAPAAIIRTIGGVLDLHIYSGPTPGDVIAQHTEVNTLMLKKTP